MDSYIQNDYDHFKRPDEQFYNCTAYELIVVRIRFSPKVATVVGPLQALGIEDGRTLWYLYAVRAISDFSHQTSIFPDMNILVVRLGRTTA